MLHQSNIAIPTLNQQWLYANNKLKPKWRKRGEKRLIFIIFKGLNDIIDVNICKNLCNKQAKQEYTRIYKNIQG